MSPLVEVTLPGGDTRLADEHWLTNRGISLLSHVTQLYMVFCRTLTWSKYIATCAGHTLINIAVKDLCCKGFDIDYLWK